MKRIGRAGEKWGSWELTGRAGIHIGDGKRAFRARRVCGEGLTHWYEESVVLIQHRGERRSAWRISDEALVPELLLGTFQSWHSMLERCHRHSHKSWPHYGGLGVRVCSAWDPLTYVDADEVVYEHPIGEKRLATRVKAFASFVGDLGVRPSGCSLDRIDPRGNYEPANVRWACKEIQARNKRRHWPAV